MRSSYYTCIWIFLIFYYFFPTYKSIQVLDSRVGRSNKSTKPTLFSLFSSLILSFSLDSYTSLAHLFTSFFESFPFFLAHQTLSLYKESWAGCGYCGFLTLSLHHSPRWWEITHHVHFPSNSWCLNSETFKTHHSYFTPLCYKPLLFSYFSPFHFLDDPFHAQPQPQTLFIEVRNQLTHPFLDIAIYIAQHLCFSSSTFIFPKFLFTIKWVCMASLISLFS